MYTNFYQNRLRFVEVMTKQFGVFAVHSVYRVHSDDIGRQINVPLSCEVVE